MSTPTITTQILRDATTGTNHAAEADLLRGARHIARSVARGFSRVDADDLAGQLVLELLHTPPVGLPGAAWEAARKRAGSLNVVEQLAGTAALGRVHRGASPGQKSGLEQVAEGLGLQPDDDGKIRFPHAASINRMHDEWGYNPADVPLADREPEEPEHALTTELIADVADEMGWPTEVAAHAVRVLGRATEHVEHTDEGHEVLAERAQAQLTRLDEARHWAREACLPNAAWNAFVRFVFRDALPVLAITELEAA